MPRHGTPVASLRVHDARTRTFRPARCRATVQRVRLPSRDPSRSGRRLRAAISRADAPCAGRAADGRSGGHGRRRLDRARSDAPLVHLDDGDITTSVGVAQGGDITIDPLFVVLQHGSSITSEALDETRAPSSLPEPARRDSPLIRSPAFPRQRRRSGGLSRPFASMRSDPKPPPALAPGRTGARCGDRRSTPHRRVRGQRGSAAPGVGQELPAVPCADGVGCVDGTRTHPPPTIALRVNWLRSPPMSTTSPKLLPSMKFPLMRLSFESPTGLRAQLRDPGRHGRGRLLAQQRPLSRDGVWRLAASMRTPSEQFPATGLPVNELPTPLTMRIPSGGCRRFLGRMMKPLLG